ncbi:MAG TPA: sulfatase, partial [Myxococcota bacterium]|nr:sulfatase [Myxococcota bacterium]
MRASLWAGAAAGALVGAAEALELVVRGRGPGSAGGVVGALVALVALGTLLGLAVGLALGLAGALGAGGRFATPLRALGRSLAGLPAVGPSDASAGPHAAADGAAVRSGAASPDPTEGPRRLYGGVTLAAAAFGGLYGLARATETFAARDLANVLLAGLALVLMLGLLVMAPAWHAAVGALCRLWSRVPFAGVVARRTRAAQALVAAGAAGAAAFVAWRSAHQLADVELRAPIYGGVLLAAAAALRAMAVARRGWAWGRFARTAGRVRTAALAALPVAALLVAGVTLRASAGGRTALSRAALTARVAAALRALTDFDRDGYSSLFGGGDCAPFDGFIHPGARDLPGNGVDEDCSGGDFVLGARSAEPPPPTVPLPAGFRPVRNVLFITVDTLRADHLHFLGYDRDTSPALDALAASGAVFPRAFCSSPRTVRSVPALLTGRYPSSIAWGKAGHDWEDLADSNETLAEVFAHAGFRTAGFALQKYFLEPRGLYQGMKLSSAAELAPYYLRDESRPSGKHITDGVIAFLRSLGASELGVAPAPAPAPTPVTGPASTPAAAAPGPGGAPRWFVWAHYYDPHIRFSDSRYGRDKVALYDESIRYDDDEIGRLLAFLRAAGLDRETLVVFTADHGQALGDHGKWGHGSNLYDEVVRVPLVFAGPGIPPFAHEMMVAEGVDVAPTICALAGVPPPADADGRSLAGRVALGSAAPPVVAGGADTIAYIEALPDPRTDYDLRALVRWPHKLVRDLASGGSELYDLVADPRERNDLDGGDRALEDELARLLSGRVADGEWARALGPAGYVTLAPPKPALPTDTLVNPYVRVLGVDAPGVRAGGAPSSAALYFAPVRPISAAWKVRVSLVGPTPACRATVDHDPAEGRHPTNRWQRGEYVVDRFRLRVPPGCK